jgi:hypothetical protein
MLMQQAYIFRRAGSPAKGWIKDNGLIIAVAPWAALYSQATSPMAGRRGQGV